MKFFVAACRLLLVVASWGVSAAWLVAISPSSIRTAQQRRTRSSLNAVTTIAEQQLGSFEPLLLDPTHRRVVLESYLSNDDNTDDAMKNLIPFETAWQRQKEILQQQVDRLKHNPQSDSFFAEHNDNDTSMGGDRVLMLEHAPVYTLGTASDERYILSSTTATTESDATSTSTSSSSNNNIPVIRMDRGGEVTYHGPGQLVVYPVLDLRHYKQDIHWYMRALEEAVLVACQQLPLTHPASRQVDTTGIWINNCKVAAFGVKCSRWITQHGLAVNVETTSLSGFDGIVPCGLEGRQVGCLNQFLATPISVREFVPLLQVALEEIFCVRLVEAQK